MYCPRCGYKLSDSDNYCAKCGNNVSSLRTFVNSSTNTAKPLTPTAKSSTPPINHSDLNNEVYKEERSQTAESIKKTAPVINTEQPKSAIHTPRDISIEDTSDMRIFDYKKYTPSTYTITLPSVKYTFSEEFDLYNRYRAIHTFNAAHCVNHFRSAYRAKITDYNSFLANFESIVSDSCSPLIKKCYSILAEYDIYDITYDKYLQDMDCLYPLTTEICKEIITTANNYLIDNENKIDRKYQSIPKLGIIGGLFTMVAVEAANIIIQNQYDSDINNNKLSPQQQKYMDELVVKRFDSIADALFIDCYLFYITIVKYLKEHGVKIWISDDKSMARANQLMSNYDKVPTDRKSYVLLEILQLNPYIINFNILMDQYREYRETESYLDTILIPHLSLSGYLNPNSISETWVLDDALFTPPNIENRPIQAVLIEPPK